MIGDIIGESGLAACEALLPALIAEKKSSLTVVNGENAADGFGITESESRRIFASGCDVITTGNHVWEKREAWPLMDATPTLLRPANYPPPACGNGFTLLKKSGITFCVVNLQGREYLSNIDCPFRTFDAIYQEFVGGMPPSLPITIVDFHAESTTEKEALGFYLDGRAAVVAGTHTHVQTTDSKILPAGTAYITDLGSTMTEDSVIGINKEICLLRAKTQIAYPMKCAAGSACLSGIVVTIDTENGKALSIERFVRRCYTI
ncbi:2',3'-cyclic-nucleotide 2'-phosphodiesterase [Spirochaetia bacterium]|nr:2',3'-cyclic-nucleotide 2'-phosphodiesterase [Spirochaetia bacterium]